MGHRKAQSPTVPSLSSVSLLKLKLLNLEEHSNPLICFQVAAQDPALFNTFNSISPALKGYKGASRPEGGLWNYSL